MARPHTFLVLDDDEDNRFLARHALLRAFPGSEVIECADPDCAIAAARARELHAVVTDHHLGTRDGAQFIAELRLNGTQCPVVMVTSSSDPAVYRRAYEAGAARVFHGNDFDYVGYFRDVLPSA